ncbi:MAG: hypothetical protein LBP73_07130 [Clostridiales Family XIII bacterium]|nr:hypothetical protein [Clostridiales Family XIII bacterium]
MIVYVSELRPDLPDEICDKLYLIVTKVRTDGLKKLVIGASADFSHASRFVVDLSALKDTTDEVAEAIGAFMAMYPETRVIVVADREPAGSPIFARLFDMGVYDVVTDLSDGTFKKCLTAGMTRDEAMSFKVEKSARAVRAEDGPAPGETQTKAAVPRPPPTRERIVANRDFKKHKQFLTVAVCGTQPHIGATHHALLTAKFLNDAGFKACFLEANERRDIVSLARVRAVNANERKHLLQFEGTDMYFDFKLPEIVTAGYDFLIFDFGRFGELEPSSFLTKDIKLVVGGVKAWETDAYAAVFEATEGRRDVRFILNHAPFKEMDGIRALMGGYKTHFSEYAPHPFASGVNLEMFKDVFGDFLTIENVAASEPDRKDKKGFFGKRR